MNDQANPTSPETAQAVQPSHWVDSIEEATARWPEEYRPQTVSVPAHGGNVTSFGEVTNMADDMGVPSEIVRGGDDVPRIAPRPGTVLQMPTRPTFGRSGEASGVASPVIQRAVSNVVEVQLPEVFKAEGTHFGSVGQTQLDDLGIAAPFTVATPAAPEIEVPAFGLAATSGVELDSSPAVASLAAFAVPTAPPAVEVPSFASGILIPDTGFFPTTVSPVVESLAPPAVELLASTVAPVAQPLAPVVPLAPSVLEMPSFFPASASLQQPNFMAAPLAVETVGLPVPELFADPLADSLVVPESAVVFPGPASFDAPTEPASPSFTEPEMLSSAAPHSELADLRAMLSASRAEPAADSAAPSLLSASAAEPAAESIAISVSETAPNYHPQSPAFETWPPGDMTLSSGAVSTMALPSGALLSGALPSGALPSGALASEIGSPVAVTQTKKGSKLSKVFAREVDKAERSPEADAKHTKVMRLLAGCSLALAVLLLGYTVVKKPGTKSVPSVPVTVVASTSTPASTPGGTVPVGAAAEIPLDTLPIGVTTVASVVEAGTPATAAPAAGDVPTTAPSDDFFSTGQDLVVK